MKAQPKLLVACEYSQRVTSAFLAKGFDAYSCDIIDTIGDHPERHLKMDARKAIFLHDWDLVIAHPPCTYLCVPQCIKDDTNPYRNEYRFNLMMEARDFFLTFLNCTKCPTAVENPRPIKLAALPRETQVVDPTMFGSRFTKRTYLWLKDLPPLLPVTAAPIKTKQWVSQRRSGHARSLLDPYFAQAMADQWSPLFL